MRLWPFNPPEMAINIWSACSQFRSQARPLIKQLSSGFFYLIAEFATGDFRSVEMIAFHDFTQIAPVQFGCCLCKFGHGSQQGNATPNGLLQGIKTLICGQRITGLVGG
jgi:hypothetical protein